MIYAIRAVGTEFVKIGVAKSVGNRLEQIETHCPHELHIEAVADWPHEQEAAIHLYLSKSNQKREWFKDGERTAQVIAWMQGKDRGLRSFRVAFLHFAKTELGRLPRGLSELYEYNPETKRCSKKKSKATTYREYVSQASQHQNSTQSSQEQLKATEAAYQFMQSLLTWESNTLRSIVNSSNTEKQNGEMLRSAEH